MKLPCELFGFNGNSIMKEVREVKLKSCLKWKTKLIEVPTPSRKSIEIWENFVTQISQKEIKTIIDFDSKIETKYEVAGNQYVRKNEKNKTQYYTKIDERNGQSVFGKSEPVSQVEWKKVIAEMKPSRAMIIHSIFYAAIEESQIDYVMPFGEEITKRIEEGRAIAATDASVKNNEMGGCQILTDITKGVIVENKMYYK